MSRNVTWVEAGTTLLKRSVGEKEREKDGPELGYVFLNLDWGGGTVMKNGRFE